MKKHILTLAAICAGSALSLQAQTTLFEDDFSGTGNLVGSIPDTTQGATTWAGATRYSADGSIPTGGSDTGAYLAFTPVAGQVYTLSLDVDITSSAVDGGFLSFGFVQNVVNARHNTGASGIAWGFVNASDNVQVFEGAGTDDRRVNSTIIGASTTTFEITLNTSDSDNVLFSLNVAGGSAELTDANIGTLAGLGINGFGFSAGNVVTGSVDNLSLVAIPESNSFALIFAGLAGFLILARRRRS